MARTAAATTGAKVRAARLRKGLSQEEVAARCGMDRANLAHIELGGRDPQVGTLKRIAKALDVPASLLI